MKKTIIIILAAGGILGFSTLKNYGVALVQQIRQVTKENTPTPILTSVAREQLQSTRQKLAAAEVAVAGLQEKETRTERELARLWEMAETGRARLAKLRPALQPNAPTSSCGAVLVHNGCGYSREEVEAAAHALVKSVQMAEATVEVKTAQLKATRQARINGVSALTQAREELQLAETKIRDLQLRIETETVRQEATATVAALGNDVTADLQGDLAETLAELEKRLLLMKEQNDSVSGPATGVIFEDATSGNVLQDVDALLKTPTETTTAAAAPGVSA